MSSDGWRDAEDLFQAAIERPPEARSGFLDTACGRDSDLRRRVESLLAKAGQAASLLGPPPPSETTVSLTSAASLVGRQIGPYRILAPLGAGGMGEVYRARDSKLGREVAIKTLPAEFAHDQDRLARFRREARTLASLNHPNIAAIYGIEESAAGDCLILELVEGEALRGPLPLAIALDRACQLAEALEAAHEKGIIHRDLKPANVKVTPRGRMKVLDFGLAKAVWGADQAPDLSQTETLTAAQTMFGKVVGTPGYMSPEQARGREVDQRTDIWAFGCLVYELLTGTRAFQGARAQDTIAAVLEREPDFQALPPGTPAAIRELLRQCLQKDANLRPRSIAEIHTAIEREQRRRNRWRLPAFAVAALLGIVIVGVAWYSRGSSGVLGRAPAERLQPRSFLQLTDQSGQEIYPSLSPDGKSFVYASRASGNWDIYTQRVGGRNAVNLTRDSPADDTQPVFSPNGEQIAFRSERDGGGIFVMGATGESVKRITDFGYNPAWSPDGAEIVCASTSFERPDVRLSFNSELFSVKVATGEKRLISQGIEFAMQPSWSPHGQRIAYWGVVGAQWDIWTLPSSGGQPLRVTNDAAIDWNPVWSPDGAYLYFASDRGGSMNLWRARIDEQSGRIKGEVEPVTLPSPYSAYFSFTRTGHQMAYVQHAFTSNLSRIAFDPRHEAVIGEAQPVTKGSRSAVSPDVSLDGEWLVFSTQGGRKEDLFVVRSDGTELHQLTDDNYRNRGPTWSPDGKRIAFYSNRSGKMEIWTIHPDGSALQRLTHTPDGYLHYPGWSPDGTRLIYGIQTRTAYIMEVDKPWNTQVPQPLPPLNVPNHWFATWRWSPDGRKIAGWQVRTDGVFTGITIYSFDTGKYEQITTDQGSYPRWLRDSRRLVYFDSSKVYLVDSQSRRVQVLLSDVRSPAISPDDRWIYFTKPVIESDVWLAQME
jgi:Tol biopolymer transport system component/serine/threonine protein kinase